MSYNRTRNPPARSASRLRGGATIVECALVLPLVVFVLFAMLDLGVAAVRYNALAEASRRVAREAIINGALSPTTPGGWGPAGYEGTCADASAVATPAQKVLPTMEPSSVTVRVTWLDGDNAPRDRVRVELGYQHYPLLPALFPWGPLDLRAVSTMSIVN